ncbi:MAG: hypothetical protein ACREXK_10485 [Gammaproteobacteria bacterium]
MALLTPTMSHTEGSLARFAPRLSGRLPALVSALLIEARSLFALTRSLFERTYDRANGARSRSGQDFGRRFLYLRFSG